MLFFIPAGLHAVLKFNGRSHNIWPPPQSVGVRGGYGVKRKINKKNPSTAHSFHKDPSKCRGTETKQWNSGCQLFNFRRIFGVHLESAIVRQTPRSILPDHVGRLQHGCVRECCGGFGHVVICLYAVIEGFCITETWWVSRGNRCFAIILWLFQRLIWISNANRSQIWL